MTIERVRHSGAYVISAFVGKGAEEYLLTRTYYGFNRREAIAKFRQEVRAC